MNDEEYEKAVLKLGIEHKQSLMICEYQRRRTFVNYQSCFSEVNTNLIAKAGFYFTGKRGFRRVKGAYLPKFVKLSAQKSCSLANLSN